jgi:hypothetical protein
MQSFQFPEAHLILLALPITFLARFLQAFFSCLRYFDLLFLFAIIQSLSHLVKFKVKLDLEVLLLLIKFIILSFSREAALAVPSFVKFDHLVLSIV